VKQVGAVQTTGEPAQEPLAWQTSLFVQAKPSLQGAPVLTASPQPPLAQVAM